MGLSSSKFVQLQRAPKDASLLHECWPKTDFHDKKPLKVILGHSFCNQLLNDKG